MEYVQMTMLELEERESSIKTKLGSIVENFLLVGKELDEIDRVSAYQLRGYKSIREYAADTFGISESFASRVLNVYRKYTEPGKELKLKEQYKGFNFSQLVELLNVPEEEHRIIRPELTKEDIRDFKRFEKENENNPGRLMAWKEENGTVRAAVEEFFRNRKKDLNEIYETYGIGPYSEETIENMARFLYHEKKKKFQTEQFFLMLYPNQVFIKSADGELRDIAWTEFFQTMGQIFDGKAAGKDTWKNYFATAQEEEQIPGQDSILKHPEYMPQPEESSEPISEKKIAPAQKTEEQKYSEKQNRIDRETKKKLEEREDEEKMSHLPSDAGQQTYQLRLPGSCYKDTKNGIKTFELRKKEKEYRKGDILELMEFTEGRHTGRVIRAEIIYILDDYTGLEEGYCIMAIHVLSAD